jgi:hypothetical protein
VLHLLDNLPWHEAQRSDGEGWIGSQTGGYMKKQTTNKEDLLLSADGDISLYKVDKEIFNNLDELIERFYKWKKTNCYDETLFVKFLRNRFGENSVEFVKIVGLFGGKINQKTGRIENDIEEEYQATRWYNF